MRASFEPIVALGLTSCARCGERIQPDEPWDLGHVDGDRSRWSGPEHRVCNRGAWADRRSLWEPLQVELPPEREGLPANDERWRVTWLKGLRRPPAGATWPRLMTVPHPRACDSLGREFVKWAEKRSGELRWWQRLVAARLLEVDDNERLVWEALLLTIARQLGKSWLLRELLLWRIHQGDRFGEPQDVLHTGKDIAICKEVQRPARVWAKAQRDRYRVREVNGQEEIEYLADGSRWMLRAKESMYGYTGSVGAVDEAWKVRASSVDEALTPTMVEREQAQLLLVSTAHRMATSLMLARRQVALMHLEDGKGDLLIEWSAPRGAALDDVKAWKAASPHWSPRREQLLRQKLEAMRAGELDDPDEQDPVESFRAQWLNQWPRRPARAIGENGRLLPAGVWEGLAEEAIRTEAPLWVGLEDDYGRGAAVAACRRLPDGRLEVDGWLCPSWDAAISDAQQLSPVKKLLVGASLRDRVPGELGKPTPAGTRETVTGLALFRNLTVAGQVIHDTTTGELDDAIDQARVREAVEGLRLVSPKSHLVRALVWAVQAAHRPAKVPAIR